jgi:hypothetical protein
MPHNFSNLTRAQLLVQRLERLSADSVWAHKASGVRAALDKLLTQAKAGETDYDRLDSLMQYGFEILGEAAGSIPASDEL